MELKIHSFFLLGLLFPDCEYKQRSGIGGKEGPKWRVGVQWHFFPFLLEKVAHDKHMTSFLSGF